MAQSSEPDISESSVYRDEQTSSEVDDDDDAEDVFEPEHGLKPKSKTRSTKPKRELRHDQPAGETTDEFGWTDLEFELLLDSVFRMKQAIRQPDFWSQSKFRIMS
jgi:hypothetical protein